MPTNRRRRSRVAGSPQAAVIAFLRGDPPPVGTSRETAMELLRSTCFAERFPLPVERWWRIYGAAVLRTWRGPDRPWGEIEAEAGSEANHPRRYRGVGIMVTEHPEYESWNRLANPDYYKHRDNGGGSG